MFSILKPVKNDMQFISISINAKDMSLEQFKLIGPLIFRNLYGIADGITESDILKRNPYSVKITVTKVFRTENCM